MVLFAPPTLSTRFMVPTSLPAFEDRWVFFPNYNPPAPSLLAPLPRGERGTEIKEGHRIEASRGIPPPSADSLAPGRFFAKALFQNLAARVSRQELVADGDVLRNFEIGDPRLDEGQEIGDVELHFRLGHDSRADFFAHHFVGDSQHGHFEDGRVGRQG